MKAKLNISQQLISDVDLLQFNSLIPDNVRQLNVKDVSLKEQYQDSVEVEFTVILKGVIGGRYISFLTSSKEVVSQTKGKEFKDLPKELKINLIEEILKNNKYYLQQSIFNNG